MKGEISAVKEILSLAKNSVKEEEIYRSISTENSEIENYLDKCVRNDLIDIERVSEPIYSTTGKGMDCLENIVELEDLVENKGEN